MDESYSAPTSNNQQDDQKDDMNSLYEQEVAQGIFGVMNPED